MSDEVVGAAANAVAEVAKTTGKALDLVHGFGGWVEDVVGQPMRQAVGWAVVDRIKQARDEQQVRYAERLQLLLMRSKARLDAEGITVLHRLSDKAGERLIEASSLEDDPALQEMWAALLARALGHGEDVSLWTTILRDLRPVDAAVFEALVCFATGFGHFRDDDGQPRLQLGPLGLMAPNDIGMRNAMESARQLVRFTLVEPWPETVWVKTQKRGTDRDEKGQKYMSIPDSLHQLQLTMTGVRFAHAIGLLPAFKDSPA